MTDGAFLHLHDVHAYYGKSHILQGISLNVQRGQVVGVLGRNGAGKTTLIHTIIGLVPKSTGSIILEDHSISRMPTFQIMRRGVAWIPQGRRIFAPLSVEENLVLAATKGRKGAWNVERVFEQFPVLKERRRIQGDKLSGGEQQMLAIARALVQNPDLFLMDEPSEGLAPRIRADIGDILGWLNEQGSTILLVEQNLGFVTRVAKDVLVMNKGAIVFRGTSEELLADVDVLQRFLGASGKTTDRKAPGPAPV